MNKRLNVTTEDVRDIKSHHTETENCLLLSQPTTLKHSSSNFLLIHMHPLKRRVDLLHARKHDEVSLNEPYSGENEI